MPSNWRASWWKMWQKPSQHTWLRRIQSNHQSLRRYGGRQRRSSSASEGNRWLEVRIPSRLQDLTCMACGRQRVVCLAGGAVQGPATRAGRGVKAWACRGRLHLCVHPTRAAQMSCRVSSLSSQPGQGVGQHSPAGRCELSVQPATDKPCLLLQQSRGLLNPWRSSRSQKASQCLRLPSRMLKKRTAS